MNWQNQKNDKFDKETSEKGQIWKMIILERKNQKKDNYEKGKSENITNMKSDNSKRKIRKRTILKRRTRKRTISKRKNEKGHSEKENSDKGQL